MKQPLTFTGQVFLDDGKPAFRLDDAGTLRAQLLDRFGEGPVRVVFARWGKARSTAQNAYYWGVVVQMIHTELQRLGNEVNDQQVHEWLKDQFLPQPVANGDGEQIAVFRKSTAIMSRIEFMEYLEEVRAWAADKLSLNIPDPKPEQMPDELWEPVKLDCGITIRPDTPEDEARYFLSFFHWRTATDLNDARYQVVHSNMGTAAKAAAVGLIAEKAAEMSCHFNPGSSTYIPVQTTTHPSLYNAHLQEA